MTMTPSPQFNGHDGVSWRDYVDVRLEAMDQAIQLAREQMDARLDSMNEFRQALRDANERQVTRIEYQQTHDRFVEDIRNLREYRVAMESKASQKSVYIAYVMAGLALLIQVIHVVVQYSSR